MNRYSSVHVYIVKLIIFTLLSIADIWIKIQKSKTTYGMTPYQLYLHAKKVRTLNKTYIFKYQVDYFQTIIAM